MRFYRKSIWFGHFIYGWLRVSIERYLNFSRAVKILFNFQNNSRIFKPQNDHKAKCYSMQSYDKVVNLINNEPYDKGQCIKVNHAANDDNMNDKIFKGLADKES